MAGQRVLHWLLEEREPAARYATLRTLLGRSETDSEVRAARARISSEGWAAQILAERQPGGYWVEPSSLYLPKYHATNWELLVLADLGVGRDHPAVRESCELWMRRFALAGGGVGGNSKGTGHHCVVGNMTRALIQMGYAEDPRIRRSLEWLVETASPLGGWSCWGSGRNLDGWEGLSAFAAYPRSRWTGSMRECVEKAAEFFLERALYRQGPRYPPWFRFHYPVHYYYDILVGLDLLTSLGYADDPRLQFAIAHLRSRRRPDGRWLLDAQHPDLEGSVATWYKAHPSRAPTPLRLEREGRPSKLVTLRAERVLARVDGTG